MTKGYRYDLKKYYNANNLRQRWDEKTFSTEQKLF